MAEEWSLVEPDETFHSFQTFVEGTKAFPEKMAIIYPMMGLCGEVGEVAEKIKKVYRDNNGEFTEENKEAIKKELGDVLWYITSLGSDLGISLESVVIANMHKLKSRKERGVIKGNGDDR